MSELKIIVTRMSGDGDKEFKKYFPNCDCWAIKNLCQKISNNNLNFDPNDDILIVDGFAIRNCDDKCKQLGNYIKDACEQKKITMHIHPGTSLKNEDALKRIFDCTNKLEFKFYSGYLKISSDPTNKNYLIDTSNNPQEVKITMNQPKSKFVEYPRDKLSFIIHKINGIVGALSLDMQLLEESDFDESILKEISEKWEQRRDAEKNLFDYINSDKESLKYLSNNGNINIDTEVLSATMEKLRTKNINELKQYLPTFKERCSAFLSKIEEIYKSVRDKDAKPNG